MPLNEEDVERMIFEYGDDEDGNLSRKEVINNLLSSISGDKHINIENRLEIVENLVNDWGAHPTEHALESSARSTYGDHRLLEYFLDNWYFSEDAINHAIRGSMFHGDEVGEEILRRVSERLPNFLERNQERQDYRRNVDLYGELTGLPNDLEYELYEYHFGSE